MGKNLLVKPHTMTGRTVSSRIKGTGMGSVLLNGSAGVAGTMTSASPSLVSSAGAGLGKSISAKLDKLRIQSKKVPENIKFSI